MTTEASTSSRANVAALVVALLVACAAFQLNATMLNPALVTIARVLGVNQAVGGLTQTVFFTSAAVFSLFLPRLSDIVGRKRVLLGMLVVMLVGTLIAALSPNIALLFVGRILQGVSGPVVPMALLMLRSAVTDRTRYGTLLGLIAAVNGGIAGFDALAGGLLTTAFGFRSIFWCTGAISVIALAMIWFWGVESKPSAGTSMDWLGVVALGIAVATFLTALNQAGDPATANWPLVVVLAVIGIAFCVVFWVREGRAKEPLATTADLRRRATWALLLTTLLTLTGVFATVNGLATSLAQNSDLGFGFSAAVASVAILTPYALIGWVVGPIAGRFAPKVGYLTVLRVGLAGSVVAIAIMAGVGVHSLPFLIGTCCLLGITYAGLANIMLNGLGIVLSPPYNPGFLPGMNAGAFNLGAGLSFAILPVLQVAGSPSGSHSPAGYTSGMVLGLVITGAALAVSFIIPRPVDAEESQTGRQPTQPVAGESSA